MEPSEEEGEHNQAEARAGWPQTQDPSSCLLATDYRGRLPQLVPSFRLLKWKPGIQAHEFSQEAGWFVKSNSEIRFRLLGKGLVRSTVRMNEWTHTYTHAHGCELQFLW